MHGLVRDWYAEEKNLATALGFPPRKRVKPVHDEGVFVWNHTLFCAGFIPVINCKTWCDLESHLVCSHQGQRTVILPVAGVIKLLWRTVPTSLILRLLNLRASSRCFRSPSSLPLGLFAFTLCALNVSLMPCYCMYSFPLSIVLTYCLVTLQRKGNKTIRVCSHASSFMRPY